MKTASPDRAWRFLWLAAASLLVQLVLGVHLRRVLAGMDQPWARFDHLRSAHSHLGYYGLLFPLAWWAWSRAGQPSPGPWATVAYGVATLVATIAFAAQGYGPASIVASTAVLAVWLWSAWGLRSTWRGALGRRHRSWWAPAAPAVVLSAVAIPAVAVTLRRDPALSQQLVQGFLTVLLFGLVVPAALQRRDAPAPDSRLWVLACVGAALFLGPAPSLATRGLTVGLALLLVRAGWRARVRLDVRLAWLAAGGGLLAVALELLGNSPLVAVAGLHLVVLGPVLVSLGDALLPVERASFRLPWLLAVVVLTLAVLTPVLAPSLAPHAPRVAAWSGGALGVLGAVGVVLRWAR